jgi:FkbH-like protein
LVVAPVGWPEKVAELVAEAGESGRIMAIRTALQAIGAMPLEQQGRPFKLGVCRTFTIEAQLDALTLALATLPCQPEILVGELENIEQLLLDDKAHMLKAEPNALLVLWRLEELHPRLVFEHDGMSSVEREKSASDVVNRIEQLCAAYEKTGTAPLFLSTLPERFTFDRATNDVYAFHGPRRAVQRINQALVDIAAQSRHIYIYDFSGWALENGSLAFDLKMDLYARQPIANSALMSFGVKLADTFKPLLLPAAKVLAIDLDNVLWGGVLGEDGIDEIKIGHDFPGNIYRRIQLHALALKRRGVLLALLSKNNLGDVQQAFAKLPDMPLKLEDFTAIRVNWKEKSENIKEIAEELNLGLDSFVFVDDQEFEREEVRFRAPQVSVLSSTEDPLQTLNALMCCRSFDVYRISDADIRRNDDYASQAQRRKLELKSDDPKEFLRTLQLKARIDFVKDETIPRTIQMLMKTNQFNLTTKRHLKSEVRQMLANPANVLLLLSLSDRFGDQGIVGLAIALGNPATKESKIDSFLLSCRAIGRGAEQALWSVLLSHLSRNGYTVLKSEYLRTDKNQQVADLFQSLGMERLTGGTKDCTEFTLNLPYYPEAPSWIDIRNVV